MIHVETQMDGALIEAEFAGRITGDDYEKTLVPAVEAALAAHDRVRLLAIMGEEFSGFDLSAAWADTKLGLGHWSGFDRVALATDIGWMRRTVSLSSPLLPCPVQVFDLIEAESARRWLRESLGAIHVIDLGGPCLQVKLMGQVDPEAYERAQGDLDAQLRQKDGFRLLVDLTEFDGWQGLSALSAHFHLGRTHAPLLQRAAIVGDKNWQHMAQRVAGQILSAETQFFPGDDIEQAKTWLAAD